MRSLKINNKKNKKNVSIILFHAITTAVFAQKKWSETPKGSYNLVKNPNGQTLGYAPNSGIKILTVNGLAFKDLIRSWNIERKCN